MQRGLLVSFGKCYVISKREYNMSRDFPGTSLVFPGYECCVCTAPENP